MFSTVLGYKGTLPEVLIYADCALACWDSHSGLKTKQKNKTDATEKRTKYNSHQYCLVSILIFKQEKVKYILRQIPHEVQS